MESSSQRNLAPSVSPEALLEHQEWMRTLARRLVSQPAGADDVVQDVWVRALQRPPAAGWPLRSWLAGVVRNVARQDRRESGRRVTREAAVARSAEVSNAVDRLIKHQDVVQAVLALQEPYRTTVVLRFYEGLPPRKISARQGVPVTTVKSRLTRGLEQLRERLASEYGAGGTWARALAPVLARPVGSLPELLGTLAVNTPTKIGIVAVASMATFAWVETQTDLIGGSGQPTERGRLGAISPLSPGESSSPAAPPDAASETLLETQRTAARGQAPASPKAPATSAGDDVHALRARFVLPDRSNLEVDRARVILTAEDGARLAGEAEKTQELVIEDVPLGSYEIAVEAGGYRHIAHTLDLTDERQLESENGADPAFFHRVTLWPDDWIPVIVRLKDGRPFRTLADEAGVEPKRYFVNAFALGVSAYPLDPGGPAPEPEKDVAIFRVPGGYQNVEIGGSVAGSIQLRSSPPLWVGLWLHGVFFGSKLLQPRDTEVLFEITPDDLFSRFASVSLRLVDRTTGTSVVEARATLKADISAHRRHDLGDVEPDDDGRMLFSRVIPGRHELAISRAGHVVQRRLEIAPGEELELGDVPIGSGPAIKLVVVDAEGSSRYSWVEIAPYEAGRATKELYHPNLHRTTDGDGVYELPVPDRLSILRVRPFPARRAGGPGSRRMRPTGGTPPVSTPNILVDPAQPPLELRVVIRDRVDVQLEPLAPWDESHRLTIHDELDLIVEELVSRRAESLSATLVAGSYRVRRWDGDEELDAMEIVVEKGNTTALVP